ncbi:MAG: hypothetical protein R3C52_15400 [Hyphomonadaceae bacterium]
MKPALLKACLPAAALATLLTACATPPQPWADNLIVPGERIGDVQLGMPLSNLLAARGTPLRTVPISGTEATTYAFDGLAVGAHETVYWIIAKDPRYRTPAGVGPGVEQIAARAAYGKPRCVVSEGATTVYDYKDFYFSVDNSTGKVSEVGVQKKTHTCDD